MKIPSNSIINKTSFITKFFGLSFITKLNEKKG